MNWIDVGGNAFSSVKPQSMSSNQLPFTRIRKITKLLKKYPRVHYKLVYDYKFDSTNIIW